MNDKNTFYDCQNINYDIAHRDGLYIVQKTENGESFTERLKRGESFNVHENSENIVLRKNPGQLATPPLYKVMFKSLEDESRVSKYEALFSLWPGEQNIEEFTINLGSKIYREDEKIACILYMSYTKDFKLKNKRFYDKDMLWTTISSMDHDYIFLRGGQEIAEAVQNFATSKKIDMKDYTIFNFLLMMRPDLESKVREIVEIDLTDTPTKMIWKKSEVPETAPYNGMYKILFTMSTDGTGEEKRMGIRMPLYKGDNIKDLASHDLRNRQEYQDQVIKNIMVVECTSV